MFDVLFDKINEKEAAKLVSKSITSFSIAVPAIILIASFVWWGIESDKFDVEKERLKNERTKILADNPELLEAYEKVTSELKAKNEKLDEMIANLEGRIAEMDGGNEDAIAIQAIMKSSMSEWYKNNSVEDYLECKYGHR